jgi:hypothetical protein
MTPFLVGVWWNGGTKEKEVLLVYAMYGDLNIVATISLFLSSPD